MTDVAKAANISRSTLYAHFPNVQAIFDACLKDFLANPRALKEQLRCTKCTTQTDRTGAQNNSRAFCEMIRGAGKHQALVDDPHFFSSVMKALEEANDLDVAKEYSAMGISDRRSKALARFQIAGCLAAALLDDSVTDWAETQETLDTFIRGGIHAVRQAEQGGMLP